MADGNWLEGRTADGRRVRIPRDPYVNPGALIEVDGERAKLLGAIVRLRDGGTTQIPTEVGLIVRASSLYPDRRDTLDGEALEPAEGRTDG